MNAADVSGLLVWCGLCGFVAGPMNRHGLYVDLTTLPDVRFQASEMNEEQRLQRRARIILNAAVDAGRVKRPKKCTACRLPPRRGTELHAHHHNYNLPLNVRWLCATCHQALHRRKAA